MRRVASVLLFLVTAPLFGQARVFVSATGLDTNPCTLSSPCRTFAAAMPVVSPGGEIVPLTTAGYGQVVIDRSVSINAPEGVYAGITATTPDQNLHVFGVNITTAGVTVNLRGINITGVAAQAGVSATVANVTLRMDRMNVFALGASGSIGIDFESAGGHLFVSDSTVRDTDFAGIFVNGAQGQIASAAVNRVNVLSATGGTNGCAIEGFGFTDVAVRDSTVSASTTGLLTAHTSRMTVENCAAFENATGLEAIGDAAALPTALMYVSNSVITHNTTAISTSLGSVLSRANNTVIANTGGETFSGTFSAK